MHRSSVDVVVAAMWVMWRRGSRLIVLGWSASLLYSYPSLVAVVGRFAIIGQFWSCVGGF